MDRITIILQKILKNWVGLNSNTKFVIILSLTAVLFIALYIPLVHLSISNTGKLLWVSNSYRYIDIKPQEDYMPLIKQDGNSINPSNFTLNGQNITISYAIDPEAQNIINEIGIHKIVDPIKLALYSTKKVKSILFDKNNETYKNVNMVFNINNLNPYAGAYVESSDIINFNLSFIKKIYENTTKEDFMTYYIGLYIHEISHLYLDFGSKNSRLRENISEYIRMITGFQPSTWRVNSSNKELPTEEYGAEGAYFLYWIEDNYPGFIKKIIEDNLESDENTYYQEHTGKSIKDLFKEFQKVLFVL